MIDHPNLCLGSYAFLWGNKQEATATWFGMLLADGAKSAAVDAMQLAWTGKHTPHPCPKIGQLAIDGNATVGPGEIVSARLQSSGSHTEVS